MNGMNPEDLEYKLSQGAGQAATAPGGAASSVAQPKPAGWLGAMFGPGGILEKMIERENPLLKDSRLPLWAKAIMTAKVGGFKGGKAFGIDFTGMGDLARDAKAQEVLDRYLREVQTPQGGSSPTVLKNEATTTTPVSRISPRRVSNGGLPSANELLNQLLSLPRSRSEI